MYYIFVYMYIVYIYWYLYIYLFIYLYILCIYIFLCTNIYFFSKMTYMLVATLYLLETQVFIRILIQNQ